MPEQQQTAGEGANQIQVSGDLVVHEGITEQRASEIAELRARQVISEYSSEAAAIVERRLEAFDRRVVEHLSRLELLGAFSDPGFQILLRKAQIGAAASGQEEDYDLLARLLSERAHREERRHRASIDRAVEVIDKLDESALRGLTLAWFVEEFSPLAGSISEGLKVMERLFSILPLEDLPAGGEWLDHLDVLDAVRLAPGGFMGLKKLDAFWGEKMPGYVAPGFEPDSRDEVFSAFKDATGFDPPIEPHELRQGYERLSLVSERFLRERLVELGCGAEQVDAGVEVATGLGTIGQKNAEVQTQFGQAIDERPGLAVVRGWWDSIPASFQIAAVGKVIARSNARRFDESGLIPPLD